MHYFFVHLENTFSGEEKNEIEKTIKGTNIDVIHLTPKEEDLGF